MSPLQGGLFSPVLPMVAGGPGGHCAIRRRQIIIGPFVVIKQEHSTCVLNELMVKCKLNLGVNWENTKILNLGTNRDPLFIIAVIQWLFN